MKTKLWQTSDSSELNSFIESYTIGDDISVDNEMLRYDITATKAHVAMLGETHIIPKLDADKILSTLDKLLSKWSSGKYKIPIGCEDGHSAIELYLTNELGEIGKKVHTGRSRNDQSLVMMRLFLMDMLEKISQKADEVVSAFRSTADTIGDVPMPGYTHQQKAMPTTVATWLNSFSDAFSDQSKYINETKKIIDQNPLGSAAGFGNSLPLDKKLTTLLLGFEKTQENPMYCGLSRGIFELMSIQSLSVSMVIAGKFATDMLFFTTQELKFFSLPDNMATGSSIMPHKRNYDVFEIMRGTARGFSSRALELYSIVGGTGSGYSRDLQLTKSITIKSIKEALDTFEALIVTVPAIICHSDMLEAAITDEMKSVAKINDLVSKGVPFREAYDQIKSTL